MIPALVAAFLAALAAVTALVIRIRKLTETSESEKARADAAEKELTATKGALQMEVRDHAATKARMEGVVGQLKAEISRLEEDLDVCEDPSAVRDRLRKLLSGAPATAAGAAGGVAGAVPPVAAPKP